MVGGKRLVQKISPKTQHGAKLGDIHLLYTVYNSNRTSALSETLVLRKDMLFNIITFLKSRDLNRVLVRKVPKFICEN